MVWHQQQNEYFHVEHVVCEYLHCFVFGVEVTLSQTFNKKLRAAPVVIIFIQVLLPNNLFVELDGIGVVSPNLSCVVLEKETN